MQRLGVAAAVLVALVVVTGQVAAPTVAEAGVPPERSAGSAPATIAVKVGAGADLQQVAAAAGVIVVRPLVRSRGLYLVAPPGSTARTATKDFDKAVERLQRQRGVLYAAIDGSRAVGDDSHFHAWPSGTWASVGSDPASWTDQPGLSFLQLDAVHRLASGSGVTIAMLDTGLDLKHPMLVDHVARGGYDFVDDDADVTDVGDGVDSDGDGMVDEAWGHGTHLAGLVSMLAPGASILPYRVLDADGTGDPFVVSEAIDEAVAAGADVINLSFGDSGDMPDVVRRSLDFALRNDVVVVAAAGNDASDRRYWPASSRDVVSVGATGVENTQLARFSNYGKWARVAAPGVDIVSTVPGGGYGRWSGTSMATAIVSGEVALLRSYDPGRGQKEIVAVLDRNTSKLSGKNRTGRGLIDVLRSLDDL